MLGIGLSLASLYRGDMANMILAASSGVAAAAHTGTTAETVIDTIAVPAIGANGLLFVHTVWTAGANNANAKNCRVRLTDLSGAIIGTLSLASTLYGNRDVTMWNRNSESSQFSFSGGTSTSFGTTTLAHTTASVDTSAGFNIVLTAALASAADSVTREAYFVGYIRKP